MSRAAGFEAVPVEEEDSVGAELTSESPVVVVMEGGGGGSWRMRRICSRLVVMDEVTERNAS